jgi:hypothetical protein
LVVTFSQVSLEFPALAAELAGRSGGEAEQAVARIVEAALTATGLQVDDRSPAAVERLAWSLDDVAWDLQEKSERGEVSAVHYNRAFLRARAASGLLELVQGRLGPAVAEATRALDADEGRALDLLTS